jgi:hypothetical protein
MLGEIVIGQHPDVLRGEGVKLDALRLQLALQRLDGSLSYQRCDC